MANTRSARRMSSALIPILLLAACREPAQPRPPDPQGALREIVRDIGTGKIQRIEVFQADPNAKTHVHDPYYVGHADGPRGGVRHDCSDFAHELTAVLSATEVQPATGSIVAHWAIAFFRGSGGRVAGIYVDAAGTTGFVDRVPATFTPNLEAFLAAIVRRCAVLPPRA